MKNLKIICISSLLLGIMAGPALAQVGYSLDFLEPGNPGGWSSSSKTFEESWTLNAGDTVEVDIWITDVPEESLLTAGFTIEFDPSLVAVTDFMVYDGTDGPQGPWAPPSTFIEVDDPVQDIYGWLMVTSNLACAEVDGDGDIILAKVTFECQSPGDAAILISPIDGFDTVAGCEVGLIYDSQIVPNTVTIHQISCLVDADCDDNNLCTVEICDQGTGTCLIAPGLECNDDNLCTTDTCDPETGECVFDPVGCNDWDACTAESCNPGTGECEYSTVDCSFGYFTDFLEPGNPGGWINSQKTFEEEWTLSPGEEIEMDIWLNDVSEPMLYGEFGIVSDPSLVSIIGVEAYDGNSLSGPWDPGLTSYFPDPDGPGTYIVLLGKGVCAYPDAGGDIILGKVRLRCESPGDVVITIKSISVYSSLIGCSGFSYDSQITPKNITIHQLAAATVSLDIKPDPLNLKCKGLLPAAILGTDEFDVRTIDPDSLRLTSEGVGNGVAPIRYNYTDKEMGDMLLKFRVPDVVEVLMLNELAGQTIPFTITGETVNGSSIRGQDTVRLLGNIEKECHSDFDCDADVDGSDAMTFKDNFGRSSFQNPCRDEDPCDGDFDKDRDVDGNDAFTFKAEFGTKLYWWNP